MTRQQHDFASRPSSSEAINPLATINLDDSTLAFARRRSAQTSELTLTAPEQLIFIIDSPYAALFKTRNSLSII